MQTRQAFLVFDFIYGKEKKESRIYGVFDNRETAVAHAEKLKKEDAENNVNPQVMPIYMHIGSEENECKSFDFRKHIAFDVTQMESPVKCDVCMEHATHFCMTHRGTYCESHIVNHEDRELDFLNSAHSNVMRYTDDSVEYVPKTVIFSEEDVDLVSQQAGVDRAKARSALIEANGDLARAILLLTTG